MKRDPKFGKSGKNLGWTCLFSRKVIYIEKYVVLIIVPGVI